MDWDFQPKWNFIPSSFRLSCERTLSYRLSTAPNILIKNIEEVLKAQKRIENIDVWLSQLIFAFY